MIVVYFNPRRPLGKQYGFHVYRPGFLLDEENSKHDFPTRITAREEAVRVNGDPMFQHEVLG